jgi:hypothetical protein
LERPSSLEELKIKGKMICFQKDSWLCQNSYFAILLNPFDRTASVNRIDGIRFFGLLILSHSFNLS